MLSLSFEHRLKADDQCEGAFGNSCVCCGKTFSRAILFIHKFSYLRGTWLVLFFLIIAYCLLLDQWCCAEVVSRIFVCCFFLDTSFDYKFEQDRLAAMRGGGNKAPPRALYRPGSGPLRKSGRSDEYDHENNSQDKSRMSSIQDRLKQSHHSSRLQEIESITEKLNDIQMNCRNHIDDHGQSSSRNNHTSLNDPRKKSKKPEQPLYVAKKVKEAMAEHDVANR